MTNNDPRPWLELDELEDKALGMFAGGMLLTVDADALSREPLALPNTEVSKVESFLDSIGVPRTSPKRVETVDEMKREIFLILETNAKVAMLAARNFEALPDEAIKSIYEELLELQQRAGRRGS